MVKKAMSLGLFMKGNLQNLTVDTVKDKLHYLN